MNPFNATNLFWYLLKISEKQRFLWCFQGVSKEISGMKWVKQEEWYKFLFYLEGLQTDVCEVFSIAVVSRFTACKFAVAVFIMKYLLLYRMPRKTPHVLFKVFFWHVSVNHKSGMYLSKRNRKIHLQCSVTKNIWVKVFKIGPSEFCGRQPLTKSLQLTGCFSRFVNCTIDTKSRKTSH